MPKSNQALLDASNPPIIPACATANANIWIGFKPPTILQPDIPNHDPTNSASWRLDDTVHGLSVIRHTSLAALHWGSPLLDNPDQNSLGQSVQNRLALLFSTQPKIFRRLQNTRLGAVVSQFAWYLDCWNEDLHRFPNLDDYEAYGLVPANRPNIDTSSRTEARTRLLRIASTAKALDAILEAEIFWANKVQSLNLVESRTRNYDKSPEILIPRTNINVYDESTPFNSPRKSAARICRKTLEWRTLFTKAISSVPSPAKSPDHQSNLFSVFSNVPNQLLESIFHGEQRNIALIAKINIERLCFTILTLWGLLDVSVPLRLYLLN